MAHGPDLADKFVEAGVASHEVVGCPSDGLCRFLQLARLSVPLHQVAC